MQSYLYIALVAFGFAAGVLVRDQKDDERMAACEQNKERAIQFGTVLSACLNGERIEGPDRIVRCTPRPKAHQL